MQTMKDLRGLTWWLFWRYTLISFIVGFLVGIVAGFFAGVLNALLGSPFENGVLGQWAGGGVGLISAFFVLNFLLTKMIGKKIGNKTIQLIED